MYNTMLRVKCGKFIKQSLLDAQALLVPRECQSEEPRRRSPRLECARGLIRARRE